MKNIVKARVWKYGDNINTDVIFPGKYTYTITDPTQIAKYALENLDKNFAKQVKKGDIIVAGENFGCGSSREQAVTCLKYAGISAILAKSFARIFFRNCINQGLYVIECRDAVDKIENGEEITIDFQKGTIISKKGTFAFPPLPDDILRILKHGGLIQHIRNNVKFQNPNINSSPKSEC